MTAFEAHPEQHSELTLELARLSSEPSPGDKSRNLGLLRSRLGLPVPAPSGAGSSRPSAAPAPSANAPAARTAVQSSGRAAVTSWQQLLAVGVVTGTIGFFMGLGFDRAPEPATPAVALPSASAPSVAIASPPPAIAAGPAQSSGADVPRASAAPAPVRTRARALYPGNVQRGMAAPSDSPASTNDFARAVQLLARARRALDRGEPALALGLLDELDAGFPRTVLDEERGATRVLALCANSEQDSASQLAQQLFAGRPRSIYARRLERSCAGPALGAPAQP